MRGAVWIFFGIAVLIAMFVGAKTLMSGSSPGHNGSAATELPPPDMVVAWGYFDGEKGVAALDPRQAGNVAFVIAENKKATKGELLLQIDDRIARLKVKAAEQQLEEAQQLPKLYEEQYKEAQATLDFAVREAQSRINTLKKTEGSAAQIEEAQQQLADKKKAGEARVEQIKLQNAPLKIAQAQTQLDEAKAMLDYFKIVAPADGTVLRVNVRQGETLSPAATQHAIEFLPQAPIVVNAEILQEWGRYIKVGEKVDIEDDTYRGPHWQGTVKSISPWYEQNRHPVLEPFRMNDVRTLRCIISVENPEGVRIGQRVRAKINIGNMQAEKK